MVKDPIPNRGALRLWLLGLCAVLFVWSGVAPTDRRDWLLEHIPTLALPVLLVWYERRSAAGPLGSASYVLLAVFVLLHVLGAHYLYSNVPYREWAQEVSPRLGELLATERNHFDRLVHFSFGVLLLLPVAELLHRHVVPARGWAVVVAVTFIGFASKIYELLEWSFAVTLSPEAAEAYNGQQGDPWDAHKDMALALLGAVLVAPVVWWRLRSVVSSACATLRAP